MRLSSEKDTGWCLRTRRLFASDTGVLPGTAGGARTRPESRLTPERRGSGARREAARVAATSGARRTPRGGLTPEAGGRRLTAEDARAGRKRAREAGLTPARAGEGTNQVRRGG